jgi:hypothetical protein
VLIMPRPSRRLTAAAGFAVILAMATPALANAQGTAALSGSHNGGVSQVVSGGSHHSATRIATAHAFPSATSTVIASTGFIDDDEVGFFWSAARGDSVAETFSGPHAIKKAVLKLDVVENFLAVGAETDWAISINGKDVGTFRVVSGQAGPITKKVRFAKISGGTYSVKIRMTNEVASGDGSISLRYAGDGPHSIALKRR